MNERIGIFGGTFDPPHAGHLALAEWAREKLHLTRVLFVPAGTPPHKRGRRVSDARHRVAMTRLAARGNPAFEVSTLETRRSGPSFTVETLRALHANHPRARLYLLIGADSLAEFHTWREPDEIARLAILAVAERLPGRAARTRAHAAAAPMRPGSRRMVQLGNPVFDVSSSMLRRRAAAGGSLRYLVPEAVERYVAKHRLYRDRA